MKNVMEIEINVTKNHNRSHTCLKKYIFLPKKTVVINCQMILIPSSGNGEGQLPSFYAKCSEGVPRERAD